ncbi:MAG: AzlD domain-containing protein [Clostridia bacterium]|nr:AzlD domain-containing protein [Clostridia bacterium]
MNNSRAWILVAVIVLVTAALRFLPFLIFGGNRKVPRIIDKLGRVLPAAIMGMLVVFCLKDVTVGSYSGWVPAFVGCVAVGVSYVWKRNTLISILLGTLAYMLLVQLVF